jgi:hypothetical protein
MAKVTKNMLKLQTGIFQRFNCLFLLVEIPLNGEKKRIGWIFSNKLKLKSNWAITGFGSPLFLYVPYKLSSYGMLTDFYESYHFQDKGVKIGPTPKNIILSSILMQFLVCIFYTRFEIALVVSKTKGVKVSQKWPAPKMITFLLQVGFLCSQNLLSLSCFSIWVY